MKEGNETKGIACIHFLKEITMSFLVYFAIAPSLQRKGVGSQFLQFVEQCCDEHWQLLGFASGGMIWEVKKESGDQKASQGLSFFKKNGGVVLPCNYMQPPVDGKNAVDMYLMYKSAGKPAIPTAEIIRHIYFDKYLKINDIDKDILEELYKSLIQC